MRPAFLTIVTITQLFGALFAFSWLDAVLKQAPFATLSTSQQLFLGVTALIFLLGLLGSILIWVRRRVGVWLSLIHQLFLVPLVIIPSVFSYVVSDALSIGIAVAWFEDKLHFSVAGTIGAQDLASALSPVAGATYYGINVFALICAWYLNRLRRSPEAMADGVAGAITFSAMAQRLLTIGAGRAGQVFLAIIALAQFFGALLALWALSVTVSQGQGTIDGVRKLLLGGTALIYVLGLLGSILIWARPRAGIWLSLIHQILITPLIIVPGFSYVLDDALSAGVAFWKNGATTGFASALHIGIGLLGDLNQQAGASYYGANVFALICALYLIALLRRARQRAPEAEGAMIPLG